jgi:TatA/E family protein of Tat protein translocase
MYARSKDDMFGIGPQELLLILVIALVVVGPRKLPEIGRSLGKGLREVRKAQDEVRKTIQVNLDDEPAAPTRAATGPSAPPPGEEGVSAETPAAAAAASRPIAEVSKTLGRGLAELRKARQEIERSFRVDLDAPEPASGSSTRGSTEPSGPESTGQEPGPSAGEPPAE